MKQMLTSLCLTVAVFVCMPVTAAAEEPESPLKTGMEKLSYAIGMQIAQSMKTSGIELDIDVLVQGLRDEYAGEQTLLSDREVMEVQRDFMLAQEEQHREVLEANLQRSSEFLEKNRQKEGVEVTGSGLQYEVIGAGDGKSPGEKDTVEVHYVGLTMDGEVFDSSRARGEPATFPLEGIVPGLTEGLQLMQEGASYRFFLPPELAYGESGIGDRIGPNEALVFEIELIEVIDEE